MDPLLTECPQCRSRWYRLEGHRRMATRLRICPSPSPSRRHSSSNTLAGTRQATKVMGELRE